MATRLVALQGVNVEKNNLTKSEILTRFNQLVKLIGWLNYMVKTPSHSGVGAVEAETTREKIKAAATEIFLEKGYAAARMQEIADRAGANKAMIFYYFRSKDALFEAIIHEAFVEMFRLFSSFLEVEDMPIEQLIPRLVHLHLQFLSENAHLPKMMARELHSGNPIPQQVLAQMIHGNGRQNIRRLQDKVQQAISQGQIRNVDAKHVLWNIIALNLFNFIAEPVLSTIFPEEYKNRALLLEKREKAIVDMVLYGLLPR
jgi:TetR/AcrR family transcriptional regulator